MYRNAILAGLQVCSALIPEKKRYDCSLIQWLMGKNDANGMSTLPASHSDAVKASAQALL